MSEYTFGQLAKFIWDQPDERPVQGAETSNHDEDVGSLLAQFGRHHFGMSGHIQTGLVSIAAESHYHSQWGDNDCGAFMNKVAKGNITTYAQLKALLPQPPGVPPGCPASKSYEQTQD